ncbi:hypothetical protein [Eudoraea chungangensis]|uniref:hypothetical protein n=1 Tax=Eudoraea chungangensis TaxID=1481905 RepID=UPI0023EBCAFE|nr:hypothetical protein [Eudoraea chungangensis]
MSDQNTNKSSIPNDEIDLGQLMNNIRKGFTNILRGFLRFFLYIKHNFIKLVIISVVGLAMGFGLNKITTKKEKIEVIVKPLLESKNYLYDAVYEIKAKLKSKDAAFFDQFGIETEKLQGFDIDIIPVEKESSGDIEDDVKYLTMLEKFKVDPVVSDVVRTEILNNSTLNHKIVFSYKNHEVGKTYAKELLKYINSNEYYSKLVAVRIDNAKNRILLNQGLIAQVDELINNYSSKLSSNSKEMEGKLILSNEDPLDITGLLGLKNGLLRDIESKKLELEGEKQAITVINFGNPQVIQKSFFGNSLILVPAVLIILFLLFDFVKYLNKKAKQMGLE